MEPVVAGGSEEYTESPSLGAESLSYLPPPGASYREPNPVIEISSLLSELYIESHVEESQEDEPQVLNPVGSLIDQVGSKVSELSLAFQTLQDEVHSLKTEFVSCNESAVNREAGFNDVIEQRFVMLETEMPRSLKN